jgi:exodeoxyribonuclease V gamma subunit
MGDSIVRIGYSKLAPKHRLQAWLELLALTVSDPSGGWRAVTIGRGGMLAVANSRPDLGRHSFDRLD